MERIAIVRVRGIKDVSNPKIKSTLESLGLSKLNSCAVVEKDAIPYSGMIQRIKDYVAWGPVSDGMVESMVLKRAEVGNKKAKDVLKEAELKKLAKSFSFGSEELNASNVNKVIRLRPPSKGYRSIKLSYPKGDLGKRDDMDSLLKRMI